jgi:hypothetical protein
MTITENTTTKLPRAKGRSFFATERVGRLPEGAEACASCGIAVTTLMPERASTITVRRGSEPWAVYLSRCDECCDRRDRATALVETYGLGRVYGNVAVDYVDAALAALDIIGIRGDRTTHLTASAADVRALVANIGGAGDATTWRVYLTVAADLDTCARSRWSHTSKEEYTRVADAYKAHLVQRLEFPINVAPPADGERGCLSCGVGTVETLPSNAATVWGKIRTLDAGALALRPTRRGVVSGYLCPRCRNHLGWRPLGVPTLKNLLLDYLGFEVRIGYSVDVPKMKAWCALPAGTEPNPAPWAHMDAAPVVAGIGSLIRRGIVRRIGDDWPGAGIAGWVQ